jgi:transposase InsO family protein
VLGCQTVTVRKWWRRQRAGRTAKPRGRPRQGTLSSYPVNLVDEAVALKQSHPHWGPANVKVQLKRDARFATARLPSPARLAVLFGERCPDAVQRRLRQAYPDRPVTKAHAPHQRWQLDGQERVDLPEIGRVTFLNLRDPVGAMLVGSRAISTGTPQQWRKVSLPEVQAFLRRAFAEWGLPLEIQTDHEPTYTGPAKMDCPSPFTLWLAGLGIRHVTSRDRRPTDQAHVERTHRTLAEMGWLDEPGTSLTALQAVLDDRRQRYNSELPVRASDCHGQPPLVAHPHAIHSGRPFQPALEWELFDLARVDAYLAALVWTRQVNAAGNVGFLGQQYSLGRAYIHQAVSLRFLPEKRCFHFTLANGTALPDRPARGLNQEDLIGFLPIELALTTPYQFAFHLQGV